MKMKLKSLLFKPSGVNVAKDQVLSIKGQKNNQIRCLDGTVWITWPPGQETTLRDGQSITVATTKMICIQAMSYAVVSVQSTGNVSLSRLSCFSIQYLRCLLDATISASKLVIRPDRARRSI
jgi:hypothetical protein